MVIVFMIKDEKMNIQRLHTKLKVKKIVVGALFVITFSTHIPSQASDFSYGGSVANPFEQNSFQSLSMPVVSLEIKPNAQVVGNADVLLTRFGIDLSNFKLGWFGRWSDFDAAPIKRDGEGNAIAADVNADQQRLEKLKIDRLKELWAEYMQAFKGDLQAASNTLMDDIKALDKRRTETKNQELQKKYAYFVELALQVKNQFDVVIMNKQVEKIMTEVSPLGGLLLDECFRQVEFNLNLAQKVGNKELFGVYDRVRSLLSMIDNEVEAIVTSVNGSLEKALQKAENDLKNTERAKNMAFKSTQYDNHILLYRQVVAELKLQIAQFKKQVVEKNLLEQKIREQQKLAEEQALALEKKLQNDAQVWFDNDLKNMPLEKAFGLVNDRLKKATQDQDVQTVGLCQQALVLLEKLGVEQAAMAEKVSIKVDELVAKYGSLRVARQKSEENLKKSSNADQRAFISAVIKQIKVLEAQQPFNQSVSSAKSIKSVGEVPGVLANLVTSTLALVGVDRANLTEEQNDKIDELLRTYIIRLQNKVKNPSENPKETESSILQEFGFEVTSVVTGIDAATLASKDPKKIAISGATNQLLNWLTKPKEKSGSSDF